MKNTIDDEKELQRKALKKFSPSERKEIMKAFTKLEKMVITLENFGTPFENVYNNDALKYDILGDGFFTYKAQGKDNSQIRILYRFIRKSDNSYVIQMHKVYIKRRNTKEYMIEFNDYVKKYIGH